MFASIARNYKIEDPDEPGDIGTSFMRFDIVTIFPSIFDSYFNESILKRAQEKKLVEIRVHDLRKYTKDKHRKVDDRPYGGGAGMVLKIDVLAEAINSILRNSKFSTKGGSVSSGQTTNPKFKKSKTKIILTSARGKQFTQKMAREWAKKYRQLVIVCGHYEGVDERVKKITGAEEISIGDYILTGGELAAMVMVDAVSRHIPGVLGKQESLEEIKGSYPVFTRPEIFKWQGKKYSVPKVLLMGDHKKIGEWRKERQH